MHYTLGQAAKATGRSKGTISHDIKTGKLSAEKQENGSYAIDAAELIRVYGQDFNPNRSENTELNELDAPILSNEHGGLALEVKRLREQLAGVDLERDRERQQWSDQVADLRRRLDAEGEERRKLVAILTDQRAAQPTPAASPAPAPEPQRGGLFGLFKRRG
jgi:hypothetical protein